MARRDVVALAALGLSSLALAVPAVWASRARMAATSALSPLARASAPEEGPADPDSRLGLLRAELARVRDELRRTEDELERVGGFRRASARSRAGPERFVRATIVGRSVNWQERSFLIDRGLADGVSRRAGVLRGGSVAGIVVEAGGHAARVAMPTEPGVMISALTLRTRRSGLVTGRGGSCDLKYVERIRPGAEPPRIGETVVTSGRLGFFPPGFTIGRVASVGAPPDSSHLNCAVRPEFLEPPDGTVWVLRPGPREPSDVTPPPPEAGADGGAGP